MILTLGDFELKYPSIWSSRVLLNLVKARVSSFYDDLEVEESSPAELAKLAERIQMLKELKNIIRKFPDSTGVYAHLLELYAEQLNNLGEAIDPDILLSEELRINYNRSIYHLNEYLNIIESLN